MQKPVFLILFFAVLSFSASAQELSDLYYDANPEELSPDDIFSDQSLLELPVFSLLPTDAMTRYGSYFVMYARRGNPYGSVRYRLGDIPISDPLERYADYSELWSLVRMSSVRTFSPSAAYDPRAEISAVESFEVSPSAFGSGSRLRLQYASRSARESLDFRSSGSTARGWSRVLCAGERWGGDANVRGASATNLYLAFAAQKGDWNLLACLTGAVRAPRSWNTAEVFGLAADNMYNSYWGYCAGRPRAARTKSDITPTLSGQWSHRLSDKIAFDVQALARGCGKSTDRLDWNDALNPYPDYYLSLPSSISAPEEAEKVRLAWADGNTDYTQINWARLYAANDCSDRGAIYYITSRKRLTASASVSAEMTYEPSRDLSFVFGLRGSAEYDIMSNSVKDLLGADSAPQGFAFYRYGIYSRQSGADVSVRYRYGRGEWSLAAALTDYRYGRRRNGACLDCYFSTARIKALYVRNITRGLTVSASLGYSDEAPFAGDIFLQPELRPKINPSAGVSHKAGGELSVRRSAEGLRLSAAAYAYWLFGMNRTWGFYNDLSSSYCTLAVHGTDSCNAGVELGAEADVTNRLLFGGAVMANSYRYISSPRASIYDYSGGECLAADSRVAAAGLVSSPSPLINVTARLSYSVFRGVRLGFEADYAALRYEEPSFFFLSDYLLGRTLSPESRAAFTTQDRLPDAFSLAVSAYYRWRSFSFSASVKNLLDDRDIVYSSYRPSRISVRQTDTVTSYTPFPSRYAYAYPRHIYLTVGYEF